MNSLSSTGGSGSSGAKKGVYALKWNSFTDHISKGLGELELDESFADVTLACEGEFIKAHKLILSMCSPFFKKLFEANNDRNANTIVILNKVKFKDLENIKKFIYKGQVKIAEPDLDSFLECAELLQVKGLSSSSSKCQKIEAATNSNTSGNSSGNSTISDCMTNSDSRPNVIEPLDEDGFEPSNETNSTMVIQDEGAVSSKNDKEQDIAGIPLEDQVEWFTAVAAEDLEDDGELTGRGPARPAPARGSTNVYVWTRARAAREALKSRKRAQAKAKSKLVNKSGKMHRNCPYCKIKILNSNLSRHLLAFHNKSLLEKGEKLFSCSVCKHFYRNAGHLKFHMKKNHLNHSGKTSPQE